MSVKIVVAGGFSVGKNKFVGPSSGNTPPNNGGGGEGGTGGM